MSTATTTPARRSAAASAAIVYDDSCRFCRRQVEWIRKKDRASVFEFVPRSAADLLERFPQLARADLNTGMRLVMADGNVHVGADAVYHVARRLPFYRYPALLYRVPGLTQIGRWAYGWVAANRYRLAGRCDDGACRL